MTAIHLEETPGRVLSSSPCLHFVVYPGAEYLMGNYFCRKVEYCFKMPIRQAWEQTIETLFYFILCPSFVAELGEWEDTRFVKMLTLNTESTKSLVLPATLKAFSGTKPHQLI